MISAMIFNIVEPQSILFMDSQMFYFSLELYNFLNLIAATVFKLKNLSKYISGKDWNRQRNFSPDFQYRLAQSFLLWIVGFFYFSFRNLYLLNFECINTLHAQESDLISKWEDKGSTMLFQSLFSLSFKHRVLCFWIDRFFIFL